MLRTTATTLQRQATVAVRRFAHTLPKPPIPEIYQKQTFKTNFLSDPSTYPLIAIMTGALCFIGAMSTNAFANYKDLRILPSHKHDVIPTWNTGERTKVTDVLSRDTFSFHRQAWKNLRHGGFGVDQEAWEAAAHPQENKK
jgi:hypothetical protein